VGGTAQDVMPTGVRARVIHTYSLIHDDLPAMDNARLPSRRLTNHKGFATRWRSWPATRC